MAMTEREFLNKVLAGEMTDEVKEYAESSIAKLDARNEKRKNTPSKAQKENAELMKAIITTITANGAMVASEIGSALGVSTQKASALCGLLVKSGDLAVSEVKAKGKGAVKQYALATNEGE